jgi:hypothetical protein
MAATKLQLNWSSVTFASVAITRVTSMAFDPGGSIIKFKGDTDVYPTTVANADNEPSATLTTGDVAALYGIAANTDATLIGTLKDARGAAGGDIIFTMTHAVYIGPTMNAPHAPFASATGTWQAWSTDGQTPPITIARV